MHLTKIALSRLANSLHVKMGPGGNRRGGSSLGSSWLGKFGKEEEGWCLKEWKEGSR